MLVLDEWWSEIDIEKRKFVPLVDVANFMRKI